MGCAPLDAKDDCQLAEQQTYKVVAYNNDR